MAAPSAGPSQWRAPPKMVITTGYIVTVISNVRLRERTGYLIL